MPGFVHGGASGAWNEGAGVGLVRCPDVAETRLLGGLLGAELREFALQDREL